MGSYFTLLVSSNYFFSPVLLLNDEQKSTAELNHNKQRRLEN